MYGLGVPGFDFGRSGLELVKAASRRAAVRR